ncbi:TerB family tellurite resistance protein [Archangium lipolyticum]|uniref:TerB family tellurite resistance protein n=1 Tax=Archangium lipolyticum TaxID=2970465 RepID=UPI00214A23BF|nr:TerB family tellurite resistance protein [Archangium lipolyticum]
MAHFNETAVAQRYGRLPKSDNDAVQYLQALKVIISADGEAHEAELAALRKGLTKLGLTQDLTKQVESFDARGVKLESVLPKMKPGGLRAKMLLRDAIEISRADGKYAQEEKAAVAQAAKLLGVDEVTVKSIESLVELEHAVKHLRKGLFPKKKK